MLKPSRLLWLTVILLVAFAALSALHGLTQAARLVHATDVHRDDVMTPFMSLVKGGAVDFDKAAAVMAMPPYSGSTPDERKKFEDSVTLKSMFFLTDDVEARVSSDIEWTASCSFVTAGVCIVAALVVGVQAWRLRSTK